ncbi:hypothetical protein RCL1_006607 [Eukaryota sp. TZLM3-RCL]
MMMTIFSILFLTVTASYHGCSSTKHYEDWPYYENTHLKDNITTIPYFYAKQMTTFINLASERIIRDFPPTFKGSRSPAVYWGTAGIAAMCLQQYRLTHQLLWLSRAEDYINVALSRWPSYTYNPKELSFLVGRPGICAVAAVIYDLKHDSTMVEEMIKEVNWFFDQANEGDEYDWERGMSGLIFSGDYLNNYFNETVIPIFKIKRLLDFIFARGMSLVDRKTGVLRFEKKSGKFFTGFGSYGSGSPVYTLLAHDHLVNSTVLKHAKATVDHYLALQTPKGQIPGDYFPDRTQWCHGIPGLLAPIGEAYRVFGEEKYKLAGVNGSNLISEIGILTNGMLLCHGVAGNVYMMIDFYRKTGERSVLANAVSMILTSLDIPKLSSLDPSHWYSWDCIPEALYASSSIGALMLYSDVLANLDDLTRIGMFGYNL